MRNHPTEFHKHIEREIERIHEEEKPLPYQMANIEEADSQRADVQAADEPLPRDRLQFHSAEDLLQQLPTVPSDEIPEEDVCFICLKDYRSSPSDRDSERAVMLPCCPTIMGGDCLRKLAG